MHFALSSQSLARSSATCTFCIDLIFTSRLEMRLFPLEGWYQLCKVVRKTEGKAHSGPFFK